VLFLETPEVKLSGRAYSSNVAAPSSKRAGDWARPVVHWEIVARDPDAQARFYQSLFHWDVGEGPIMNIAAGLGSPEPGPAGHIRQGDTPAVSLYVQVKDLRQSLSDAESLGGTVVVEPFDIPGGPTIAAIQDPEGNGLFLVQQ
jgi:predicted enzyme related to lactoylglutathione lyase